MSDVDDRLREHPRDRFSSSVRHLKLEAEFDDLLAEPEGAIDNHRQISLVQRQGLSLILFYFEKGGTLPEHDADGEVSIHVLDGVLEVGISEGAERVTTGELLMLAPGVAHDVEALEATKMLLTIGVLGD